jgi:DNA (cytosine-5)-methyltransferase 1
MPEHRERTVGSGQDYVRTRGGILIPPWAAVAPAPKPLAIGLFSGAGGMDCGLAMAGFHVVAALEWWPVAAETYLCNLGSPSTLVYVGETPGEWNKKERKKFAPYAGELVPAGALFDSELGDRVVRPGDGWISQRSDHPADGSCAMHIGGGDDPGERTPEQVDEARRGFHDAYCLGGRDFDVDPCELLFMCDIRELTGDVILDLLGCEGDDITLVAGGPPCQGFSRSNGKRSRHDGRNQLVFEFARLVCEIHPKAMMMENVPGIIDMVTPEGVPVLDALSLILEEGGMGEYDALRKSLAANAGAGAVKRGTRLQTKKGMQAARDNLVGEPTHGDPDEIAEKEHDDAQLELELA